MNGVSVVGHLADASSYAAAVGEPPAPAAFSIGVPRRQSSAVDCVGVAAIVAQAEAVAGAGRPAGSVVALSRPLTPALAVGVPKSLATTWAVRLPLAARTPPRQPVPPATSSRWLATHVQPLAPARTPQSPGGPP